MKVEPSKERRRCAPGTAACVALIVLSGLLSYWTSLAGGFVLDDRVVWENPYVHEPGRLWKLFVSDYWGPGINSGLYRPVVLLTLSVQNRIHGRNPLAFHLFNVVFHLAASVLVYALVLSFGTNRLPALMGALLFAVHPVHSEAVANVSGRSELLSAFFALAAILLWRARTNPALMAPLCALSFFMGLLCKESSALVPAVILLAQLYFPRCALDRKQLLRFLVFPLVFALYAAMRVHALGSFFGAANRPNFTTNPIPFLPRGEALGTALGVAARYLRLLLIPTGLSADYSFARIEPIALSAPLSLAGAASLAALALAAFVARKRLPLCAFAAIFFLTTYSLISNLGLIVGTIMAERLLYFPSLAVCLCFAEVSGLARTHRGKRAGLALAATVVLCFGAVTFLRNPVWADSESLAVGAVESAPRSFAALQMLAAVRMGQDRLEEALALLERIEDAAERVPDAWRPHLEEDPRVFRSRNMKGVIYMRQGANELAERAFVRSLSGYPEYPDALINLGHARLALGRPDEALAPLTRALALRPGSPAAMNNLALVYLSPGPAQDLLQAEAWARRAVAAGPGVAELHDTLGDVLAATGRPGLADAQYRKALALCQPGPLQKVLKEKLEQRLSVP